MTPWDRFGGNEQESFDFLDMLNIMCTVLQVYSLGQSNEQEKIIKRIEEKIDNLDERLTKMSKVFERRFDYGD